MRIFSCFKPLVLLALALAVPLAAAQITCKVTERIGCFSDFIQSKRCYPVGPIDVASQVTAAFKLRFALVARLCRSPELTRAAGGVCGILLHHVLQTPGRRVRAQPFL